MEITKSFKKIKLRWKLSIIFVSISILIFCLSNTLFYGTVLSYLNLINLPTGLVLLFLTKIIPCDGLGCLILGLYLMVISIILFWGGLGFLLGYIIEKRKKK